MNKYTRKEQVEDFIHSLRRALHFSKPTNNHAYPKELAKFTESLEQLVNEASDIEFKYFEKQWQKEDEEA